MTTRQLAPVASPAAMNNKLVKFDAATGTLIDGSLLAGGANTVDVLGSDVTATSSTALADTGLQFSVGIGETWTFTAMLDYDGATTGDLKVGVTVPTSTTWRGMVDAVATGAGSGATQTSVSRIPMGSGGTLPTSTSVGASGAGTRLMAIVLVQITNITTAGTVKVQFAQGTSDATATTIYAGSSLVARRAS